MTAVLTATLAILASGNATFIDERHTPEVVARRLAYGDIDITLPHAGYAALLEPAHIGRLVTVACPSGVVVGPLLVIDCAAGHDREYLDGIDFAVDLFGRSLWDSCVIRGKSAWVDVRPWRGWGKYRPV